MNTFMTEPIGQLKIKMKELGADDAGIVSIDSPLIADQREDILKIYPQTKALISFVIALNIHAIQTRNKPIMNYEAKNGLDRLHEASFKISRYFNDNGAAALSAAPAFPMDMTKWAGKIWDISHKPIAVAAGLGTIGINRCVLHPKYGTFILLGTILINTEFKDYDKPLEKEVCIHCYLCVKNCPARALSKEGIDFLGCLNNSYRYFMPGFIDLVKDMAESKTVKKFEKKWPDDEILQMWQSLTYEGYYNCGYCISVCPAHLGKNYNKLEYEKEFDLPIKHDQEKTYIIGKNNKKELPQRILPLTCKQAIEFAFLFFKRENAKGIDAVIQYNITGKETGNWHAIIKGQTCIVKNGVAKNPTLTIDAPSHIWLKISRKEKNAILAYIFRQFKAKGDKKLLRRLTSIF